MADTVLQYSLLPNSVQANSRANFTLNASNGNTELLLTSADEIYLKLPVGTGASELTSDLSDIGTSSPGDWRFSKNPNGGEYNFIISPLCSVKLPAYASLPFVMMNVVVNAQAGNCMVDLQEFIGTGDASRSFVVGKTEAKFSIVAQAIPLTVGKTQTTILKWSAAKAAYVTIEPLGLRVDTSGEHKTTPYKDLLPPAPQVSYTFTAWTQDQQFTHDIVVVTISPQIIHMFSTKDPMPIDYDASVTLEWQVDYAETVALLLPQGAVQVKPNDSLVVQPKSMLNGNTAKYILRATGTGNAVQSDVTIEFKPVIIDYFRYLDFDNAIPTLAVTNGRGGYVSMQGEQGLYYCLTATGPFGPLTQYLGNCPQLQVQVFIASAQDAAPGTALDLQWQTHFATGLSLQFDGVSHAIASDQIARGGFSVAPMVSTQYVLAAMDAQGNTITSSLSVTVAI